MGRKIGKIIVVLGMIFFLNSLRSQAEEIPKPYQIKYEKLQGGNVYYTVAPEIEIEHFDELLVTKYKMTFPDGKELTGRLNKDEREVTIEAVLFLEGEHLLEVWMENEDGEKIDGTETKKIFKIDRMAPTEPLEFSYEQEESGEVLCFSTETSVKVQGTDSISGIQGFWYQFNEQEEQFLEGESISIPIPVGFEGKVTAYAVDHAGNRGEKYSSKMLICEDELPAIEVEAPEGFHQWYNQPISIEAVIRDNGILSGIKKTECYVNGKKIREEYHQLKTGEERFSIMVNELSTIVIETEDYAGNKAVKREQIFFDDQSPEIEISGIENYMITSDTVLLACTVLDNYRVTSVSGEIIRKDMEGTEKHIRIENWEKEGEQYLATEELNEDGIYQLNVKVQDQAGNQSEKKMQVIIDKKNPVISQIEKLQDRYLPFFEWNYCSEEFIQDFTSYTYTVSLDHRICKSGVKYMEEGKHILEVAAEDAAGNRTKRNVEFIIDHTSPNIRFHGIEEDGIYEEKAETVVQLDNDDDTIAAVYIDGELQLSEKKGNSIRYLFQKPGRHRIKVVANDLAGNKSEKEIQFTVEEKKLFFEKIFQGENRIEKGQGVNKKQENKIFFVVTIIGSCIVFGIVLYKKRKVK